MRPSEHSAFENSRKRDTTSKWCCGDFADGRCRSRSFDVLVQHTDNYFFNSGKSPVETVWMWHRNETAATRVVDMGARTAKNLDRHPEIVVRTVTMVATTATQTPTPTHVGGPGGDGMLDVSQGGTMTTINQSSPRTERMMWDYVSFRPVLHDISFSSRCFCFPLL